MFKDRNQILSTAAASDNWKETKILLARFKKLKTSRNPFYLDLIDLEAILRWKLRSQYGRQKHIRELNTDKIVCEITETAFTISHLDNKYETELKLNLLCTIRGVGIPVATAILSLCYPDKYAVIDFRVWEELYKQNKSWFSLKDYHKYMKAINEISVFHGATPREVDHAIWQLNLNK